MAINFPDSPTNGQTYTSGTMSWIFDGAKWVSAVAVPAATPSLEGAVFGRTIDGNFRATALGAGAMAATDGLYEATAVGFNAMGAALYSDYNTAVGFEAMGGGTQKGGESVAVGYSALYNENEGGGNNTAIGAYALINSVTGNSNTAVGHAALQNGTAGAGNTAVGDGAGNSTGSNNLFLGKSAGNTETGSNKLYIANSNTATPLIYGEFDNAKVSINGSLKFTEAAREKVYTTATGFAGYTYYSQTNGAIQYVTANSTANGTVNIRPSSTLTMNNWLAVGESTTIVLQITNGATAYYPNAWQIDGAAVTPKWLTGTAPTAGNTNAVDAYTMTIVKTAASTYTVFGSVAKFA